MGRLQEGPIEVHVGKNPYIRHLEQEKSAAVAMTEGMAWAIGTPEQRARLDALWLAQKLADRSGLNLSLTELVANFERHQDTPEGIIVGVWHAIIGRFKIKESMKEEFNQYPFLDNIFQHSALTVFKETKIKFGCSCKRKTLLYTLSKYPKEQLEDMCDKKEKISANCQFCGRKFQFSLKQISDYYEG